MLGDRARTDVERASDGTVSTPERGETQDPHLPVGEVGETGDRTGGRCRQAFPGALALAGARLCRHQRDADDIQESSLILREATPGTRKRDANDPPTPGPG